MSSDQNILHAILKEFQELKKEMRIGFKKVDERFDHLDNKLSTKIDTLDEKLTKRLDRIGGQVAFLEDDAPTRMEFNQLEKRVTTLKRSRL